MFSHLRFMLMLAAPILLGAQTSTPAVRTGPQLAKFHSAVDNSDQPYALYVPRGFDPSRKYPLVISLHEEDSNHRLGLRRVMSAPPRPAESDTEDMRFFPPVRDVDFLIACPLARGTMGYQGIAERDVYDVLADVERRFPVDADRVYLTGISMGGAGALRLALTRPDVWAAVAALCPAPVPGAAELAPNALNLPIRLFHGDLDPVIPPDSSRAWQRRFLDLGVPADYVEYAGVRHNAWDIAYRDGAVFEWFSKFRRNRFPERVRLVTRSYRYGSAYWVRIDGLTPGVLASLDARRLGPSAVEVATNEVDGFSLVMERPASQVTIDGTVIRVKPAVSLSFTKASGAWRAGRFEPAGKRPGAEGPIAQAVSGPHIYVYGTTGAHTADELDARRKIAETAAQWSTTRSRLSLSLPIKADTAVTASDIGAVDLVLFGNAGTNTLIARWAALLPLALNPGAADYGLLFIAPVAGRYVLVNSGLPWWSGSLEGGQGGVPFAPEQFRLLSTFGDFVLFKGSIGNVVAEGRFDRNWKVPPDAAAKMLATGTVTIR